MSEFSGSLKSLQSATKDGLKELNSLAGGQKDVDLMLFEQLKPEDFASIAVRHGSETTMNFIREMESRRLAQRVGR